MLEINYTLQPLQFIIHPVDKQIVLGNNVQFNANTTDTNVIFQWQTNLGFGWQNLFNAGQYNGVKTTSLTVFNVSMSNNNQIFRCVMKRTTCADSSGIAKLTVYDATGMNEFEEGVINVYPNPSNGKFRIDLPESTNAQIHILNIQGKEIYPRLPDGQGKKFNANENFEIDLEVEKGIYFLRLENENGIYTRKIVIQ